MASESQRQQAASISFLTTYQYIWVGCIVLLALRHLILRILDRKQAYELVIETAASETEKNDADTVTEPLATVSHTPTRLGRLNARLYHPISDRPWASCISPLRIFVVLLITSVNIGFSLAVATDIRGKQTLYVNTTHMFAMRSGVMAFANAPAVFALSGRNSIVSLFTGIESQHLRFVHKTFGYVMLALTLTHFMGATFFSLKWQGGAGLVALFELTMIQWGVLALVGGVVMTIFSTPFIRRRQYELFVISHILGAITILIGIRYHVPELAAWTYAAIGFWVFERVARVLQLFSIGLLARFKLRSPVIRADAELVHGAILLRVPFPTGGWHAGQFAYLRIVDPVLLRYAPHLIFQAHPFTIANVPTSSMSHEPEMLFVLRVRGGMTATLAKYLERTSGSARIFLAVEGPYGSSVRADRHQDVLLVAGGAGITHIMSIMAGVIEKGRAAKGARTKRVQLVWIVQHLEQADWIVQDLFQTVNRAHRANITLTIKIYVTRGRISALPSPMSSSESLVDCEKLIQGGRADSLTGSCLDMILLHHATGPNTSIIAGRAPTASLARDFVTNASSTSAVVACGPIALTEDVRSEVAHLSSAHGVVLEIASFEC